MAARRNSRQSTSAVHARPQRPHQGAGELDEAVHDSRPARQIPGQDEEGNGEEREGIHAAEDDGGHHVEADLPADRDVEDGGEAQREGDGHTDGERREEGGEQPGHGALPGTVRAGPALYAPTARIMLRTVRIIMSAPPTGRAR